MERGSMKRNISPTRYATIEEAKTVAQTLLQLKEEQFKLENVKSPKIK